MKKNKFMIFFSLLMCLMAILVSFHFHYTNKYRAEDDIIKTVYINDFEDFKNIFNSKILNDKYVLTNNIEIPSEEIKYVSADLTEDAIFDGNGYSILNMGGFRNQALFNENHGLIMNLSFEKCEVATYNQCFGMFANYNYGQIRNCSVIKGAISITVECKNVGFITGINFGVISNCYVESRIYSNKSLDANQTTYLGAIAGANKALNISAKISNCFSVLDIIDENNTIIIGGITTSNNNSEKEAICDNCYIQYSEGLFIDRMFVGVNEIEKELLNKDLFMNKMFFNNEIWDFSNEYPVLRKNISNLEV